MESIKLEEQTLNMIREMATATSKPQALVMHDAVNSMYRFFLTGRIAGLDDANKIVKVKTA